MKRRGFIGTAALAAAAMALVACVSLGAEENARPPNVVLILADDK